MSHVLEKEISVADMLAVTNSLDAASSCDDFPDSIYSEASSHSIEKRPLLTDDALAVTAGKDFSDKSHTDCSVVVSPANTDKKFNPAVIVKKSFAILKIICF